MAIDVSTVEGRHRELRNIALIEAKRHLERTRAEIDYLILGTASGERRNTLTAVNIHLMSGAGYLDQLGSEES